jgi:hypothetical protein
MFFALSAMTNYSAAVRFGYLLIITIPAWDQQIPTERKVEQTLWAFATRKRYHGPDRAGVRSIEAR